ncbi:MAG: glycosyltransferase family A protein [Roseovarius sp.]
MYDPAQLKKDAETIRKSGYFDADWYLGTYPDVAMLGMDPAEHYLKYGKMLGRNPAEGRIAQPELEPAPPMSDSPDALSPLAISYADQSLRDYTGPKRLLPDLAAADQPRVSVVMTSHNAAATIEKAVASLVNQSWPNIEILVCDDRSTDGTWDMLLEMRRRSPDIVKLIRLECNSGTYLAKNAAIEAASGDFILFQDSDDYSHPDRVTIQILPLLENPDLVATRTKYSRFDPTSGRIVPVAGLLSKYGLITLALRRSAFCEIGYFDAVRRAGDDEWYQRLLHLYGKNAVRELEVTLYLAELRQNSLIADMLSFNSDGSVEQTSSQPRKTYVKQFRDRFSDPSKTREWYQSAFPAMPREPVAIYPDAIAALEPRDCPIFASLCSIPRRQDTLAQVVARIAPQVDHLYVYLDKYEKTPDFLQDHSEITVWHSKDFDRDFRDNAKFLAYDDLKKRHKEFHYVTCDDDLIYPCDYVRTLIDRLDAYDRRVVAGVHGVICEEYPTGYSRRRFIYHFVKTQLKHPRLVNNLGTGTLAFHSDLFDSLDPRSWPIGGMVDIFLSIEARRRSVPMLCIDRVSGWMGEADLPEDNPTLFHENQTKEQVILDQLNGALPWGYKGIIEVLSNQPETIRARLEGLLPIFADAVSVEQTFRRQREQ